MIEQNTILDLVGSVPIGVILVAGNRQVISLNRRAREITERADSLVIRNNLLSGVQSTHTGKLGKLIAGAIHGGNGANCMAIFRDSSDWPLCVSVVPVESRCAAVLISDPERKRLPDYQVLGSLFGLTPAECRLASLLMHGVSLIEAARELNVTPRTARMSLKAIFQKTGTSRQNHLMYLLLSIPAPISLKNGNKRNKSAYALA